jgi:translation initiation factor 1
MKNDRNRGGDGGSVPVWSSEKGRLCPGCGEAATACACRKKSVAASPDGIVRVGRETKGRGGKSVITVTGAPVDADGLQKLVAELKKRCGTGGTVKDGVIEIQGEHRETIVVELEMRGWKVKKSGG